MNDYSVTLSGVFLFVSALLLFIGLIIILNMRNEWQQRYEKRVAALHKSDEVVEEDEGDGAPRLRVLSAVGSLGELVTSSGLLSKRTLEEFQATLRIAGFRDRSATAILVGLKLVLFAALPAAAWLVLGQVGYGAAVVLYGSVAAAIIGLIGPDMVIRHLRKRHLAAIEAGLADALDMLVICSQAGLGLEPALERVANEIQLAHSAVAEELIETSQEMKINADRRIALINLGKRTGLECLRRLGTTLVQTMQYGTPVSDALRTLSAEQRQEMLNRFETRAGRLSVLLTIPMIVFILPCLTMVLVGPGAINALHVLHNH